MIIKGFRREKVVDQLLTVETVERCYKSGFIFMSAFLPFTDKKPINHNFIASEMEHKAKRNKAGYLKLKNRFFFSCFL